MGCGCNKKKKRVSLTTNQVTSLKPNTVVKTKTSKCSVPYPDIREIDLKAVILYNETKELIYLEINKELRQMMLNYKNECPDEDNFKSLKDFVTVKMLENAK